MRSQRHNKATVQNKKPTRPNISGEGVFLEIGVPAADTLMKSQGFHQCSGMSCVRFLGSCLGKSELRVVAGLAVEPTFAKPLFTV